MSGSLPSPPQGLTIVVGGVGELFQGDLDFGRLVVERLNERPPPQGVLIEDFCYGAIAVTARLEEIAPDVLILVGAKERGRTPGTVTRRVVEDLTLDAETIQVAVGDAAVGYVDMDLTLEVAWGFEALPARTVAIELEPAIVGPGEGLSPEGQDAMATVIERIERELELSALFDLVGRLKPLTEDSHLSESRALTTVRAVLAELERFDREGRWGRTFAEKDHLQLAIAEGATSEEMDHLDWGLWWGLVEEVERVERASVLWD